MDSPWTFLKPKVPKCGWIFLARAMIGVESEATNDPLARRHW